MEEKEKTSYDILLEEIDKLKEDNSKIRKELNDMKDFNRALLARGTNNKHSTQDIDEKFKKYLEGE